MKKTNVINWFRRDLRINDNPSLYNAAIQGDILPIYIIDNINCDKYAMGEASKLWLYHSLKKLNKALDGKLIILKGDPIYLIPKIVIKNNIKSIYWNRCYEPWQIKRDKKLKALLQNENITVNTYNGSLLWEPWQVLKKDKTAYKVFTPFYRKGCLQAQEPRTPLSCPNNINYVKYKGNKLELDATGLIPKIRWDKKLEPYWNIGEDGAKLAIEKFLDYSLPNYKEGRNFPHKNNISRLSPHLHFGEISPNQVWHAAQNWGVIESNINNIETFCSELGWREFSYHLLYHFPEIIEQNLNKKFNKFPWQSNKTFLTNWQLGQTGYPIIDAGMRELWQTGYMHNRIRMVVASFLVKNLLINWKYGASWFWNCLVDADLANNTTSWQWVAGCGADAAPYFRIFNPITQGQKFDPTGKYTRKFLPELQNIPDKYLFNPWTAPNYILNEAKVVLGQTYPYPIVNLKTSREKALSAYNYIRK